MPNVCTTPPDVVVAVGPPVQLKLLDPHGQADLQDFPAYLRGLRAALDALAGDTLRGDAGANRLSGLGGELICQKDSFLCAAKGVSVGIAFNKKIGAGLFGGEGFIMQRLQGDGWAFLHAGGTIHQRDLAPGDWVFASMSKVCGMFDIRFAGHVSTPAAVRVWLIGFSRWNSSTASLLAPSSSASLASMSRANGQLPLRS